MSPKVLHSQHVNTKQDDILRHKKHRWTTQQRVFILIVNRMYTVTPVELSDLFNDAFETQIAASGFVSGRIPKTSVATQLSEILTLKHKEYALVYDTPVDVLGVEFQGVISLLLRSSKRLSITLTQRDPRVDDLKNSQTKVGKTRNRQKTTEFSDGLTSGSDEALECLESETDWRKSRSPVHKRFQLEGQHLITPPFTPVSSWPARPATHTVRQTIAGHPCHDDVPYLLFRVFDENSHGLNSLSGFTAGIFEDRGKEEISAPYEDDPRFLNWAENHLDPNSTQASPFISLTTSLIWAFKRALDRENLYGCHVWIAVIDGRTAAGDNRLYHAQRTCRKVRALGRVNMGAYNGTQEFWVWHSIHKHALLGCLRLDEVRMAAQTCFHLNRLLQLHEMQRSRSMATVLKHLQPLRVDESLAIAIAKLLKLIKAGIRDDHFLVKDFSRVILQNYRISGDLDEWTTKVDFLDKLKECLRDRIEPRRILTFRGIFPPPSKKTTNKVVHTFPTLLPQKQQEYIRHYQGHLPNVQSSTVNQSGVESNRRQVKTGFPQSEMWLYSPYE